MQKQKTHHDVWGWQNDCPNYMECPLCYGCRNYDEHIVECVENCGEDRKQNVCNTARHKYDLLAKLLSKEIVKV